MIKTIPRLFVGMAGLFFCFAPAPFRLAADETPAFAPLLFQRYTWREVAIGGGGFVTGLLFHPAQPDLLYARTDVGGAYRWNPSSHRWLALNDSIAADNAQLLGIVSFAVDARDPQRLYLACGQYLQEWGKPAALLWSPDQGATWGRVPLPFRLGGNADGRSTGERLQVDPHAGEILFLGTNQDGLWRSEDRARTWKHVGKFPARSLTFVLFDARSGTAGKPTPVIYAGTSDPKGPAVFRSTDAGVTWKPLPGQPTGGLLVHHAAFDSAHTLYLTFADRLGPNGVTRGAVWKFTPATSRWDNITPEQPDAAAKNPFGYAGLAVDAQHPGTVLVTTLDRWARGDEIFRTTDGGATWKALGPSSTWNATSAPYAGKIKPHWMGDLALDPFNSDRAWFITGYGVWTTEKATASDGGAITPWTFADDGLEETVVDGLISPPEGAPLISALGDIGGFRHDDFRVSPPQGAHEPPHGSNASIAFAERAPLKLVRTHSGRAGAALSRDGGTSWTDFPTAPSGDRKPGPGSIALSADGRGIVWLPKNSGPFFSNNDGASWTPSKSSIVSSPDYWTDIIVADRVNPEKFYLYHGASGQVHVSTDGGASFASVASLPAHGGALCPAPGREGSLWVPTPDGLFVSHDTGAHFEKVPGINTAAQVGFGAAPTGAPPMMFMLGRVRGVPALFRSDDLGGNWIAISDASHKFGYLKVITGDARVPGRVYLGTGGRGIVVGDPQ